MNIFIFILFLYTVFIILTFILIYFCRIIYLLLRQCNGNIKDLSVRIIYCTVVDKLTYFIF